MLSVCGRMSNFVMNVYGTKVSFTALELRVMLIGAAFEKAWTNLFFYIDLKRTLKIQN